MSLIMNIPKIRELIIKKIDDRERSGLTPVSIKYIELKDEVKESMGINEMELKNILYMLERSNFIKTYISINDICIGLVK